jgi:hypothetical protein
VVEITFVGFLGTPRPTGRPVVDGCRVMFVRFVEPESVPVLIERFTRYDVLDRTPTGERDERETQEGPPAPEADHRMSGPGPSPEEVPRPICPECGEPYRICMSAALARAFPYYCRYRHPLDPEAPERWCRQNPDHDHSLCQRRTRETRAEESPPDDVRLL